MKIRRVLLWGGALAGLVGLAMRWLGMSRAGWVLGAAGVAWVFLYLLPVTGSRAREPADSPLRRAHWGD